MILLKNIYIYICFINNIAFLKKKIKKYRIITQAWSIQPIQIRGKREYSISKQEKKKQKQKNKNKNKNKKTKTKQKGLAEILMP